MNDKDSTRLKIWLGLAIVLGVLAALWIVAYTHNRAHAASYDYQYVGQQYPPAISKQNHTYPTSVTIKNTGALPWNRDVAPYFRLGTSHPNDAASQYCVGPIYTTGWLPGCNRVQLPVPTVLPGQTVTIPFTSGMQDYGGRQTQYFTPVVEGVQWLTDIGLYQTSVAPASPGIVMFQWYKSNYRWGSGSWYGTTTDTPSFPGFFQGYYDSNDLSVFDHQATDIQNAGMEYVIFDYWLDGGDAATSQANAFADARELIAKYPNLKFSFVLDSGDITQVPQSVYDTIYSNFGSSPQFFSYMSKPLLYTINSVQPVYDGRFNQFWWTANSTASNTLYWANPGTVYSKNYGLTLEPSYDDCAYKSPCTRFDPTQTGSGWNSQFSIASNDRDSDKILAMYGLNEYYENALIEPHVGPHNGSSQPDFMINLIGSSLASWKAGQQ